MDELPGYPHDDQRLGGALCRVKLMAEQLQEQQSNELNPHFNNAVRSSPQQKSNRESPTLLGYHRFWKARQRHIAEGDFGG